MYLMEFSEYLKETANGVGLLFILFCGLLSVYLVEFITNRFTGYGNGCIIGESNKDSINDRTNKPDTSQ